MPTMRPQDQMTRITGRMTTEQITEALEELGRRAREQAARGETISEIITVEMALIDELERRDLIEIDDDGRTTWKATGEPIPGEE